MKYLNFATIGPNINKAPSFDGSDTAELVKKFLENGGQITKLPTRAPSTGDFRFKKNPTKVEDPDASCVD